MSGHVVAPAGQAGVRIATGLIGGVALIACNGTYVEVEVM